MSESFASNAPIYLQIINKICSQIVRGEIRPGDKLASVREMAVQFGVNPNTVQRVNMELERLGLVEMRRGQGTYVTENGDRLKELRRELKLDKIRTFVGDMREMGFEGEEIYQGLQEYMANESRTGDKRDE